MKKILITGAGSYIGGSVGEYLARWPEDYQVDTLSVRGEEWKNTSFQSYDAVLHVAGIVHQKKTKDDPACWEQYRQVNVDLAVETARKAKAEGVGQFLFMSSESVYGLSAPLGKQVVITRETPLHPVDNYGRSKAQAEAELEKLAGEDFRLAILRPPIVYGKGCRGNYVTLAKLAKKLPVFPKVENQRSMLYMENLAELIRQLIDDRAAGVFCPQNNEYANTSDVVSQIAHAHGKNLILVGGTTWGLKLLSRVTPLVDKAFGSLCYDWDLSRYSRNYCVRTLTESIIETER